MSNALETPDVVMPAADANRDPARPGEFEPLRIGPMEVWPPVVLAPMAGVTDAPFRVLCSEFGPGVYVNQMITARGWLEGHPGTRDLARFHPAERVRSLQLYGTDPESLGEAVRRMVGEDLVDHIDMNLGCPAAKVTRHGGGAALPWKRRLLARVLRAAVAAADAESGGRVPITIKFRLGLDDEHLTFLDTGRIAEAEGIAAVALHARTALEHYAPPAHWDRIGELVGAVGIPVLGNGEIWEAPDALAMMRATGCAGVVIGRGCLGRPWMFRDLATVFGPTPSAGGAPEPTPPTLGEMAEVVKHHTRLFVDWHGNEQRISAMRKHLAWYLKGYPVGGVVRGAAGLVNSVAEVDALMDGLDATVPLPETGRRLARSHTGRLHKLALPDGWLDDPDEDVTLSADADADHSGG